jgi:hypothetical protein
LGREAKMPKFVLLAAALLLGGHGKPSAETAHDLMSARTRTREATRRLRAARIHDPYFDLSPLDLSRRH